MSDWQTCGVAGEGSWGGDTSGGKKGGKHKDPKQLKGASGKVPKSSRYPDGRFNRGGDSPVKPGKHQDTTRPPDNTGRYKN